MKIYAMIYIPYFVIQYFKFCHVWLYYFICFSIFHSLSVSHGWSRSDTITGESIQLKTAVSGLLGNASVLNGFHS